MPVRAGCGKPRVPESSETPKGAGGWARPLRGQLLCGWLCISCFANSSTSLLYVLWLENGVETTALGVCSPLLFCRLVGVLFCFVLISVAAERHPGQRATQVPVGAAALLHGHLLLRGACASGCYADASGRRGRERTGVGEGEAVALAMTEHRWGPASLSPGHFVLCGPLPP